MEKWFVKKYSISDEEVNNIGIDKYVYSILLNRGINKKEDIIKFLNPSTDNFHSPFLLPNLIKGSNILISAIKENKKIRIVGDYDVDGVMSTFILYKGLKSFNANVDYVIPNRIIDGYGINNSIIDNSKEDGIDLILTCDNGIAASNQVNYANDLGIEIIVTDHHEVPVVDGVEILPKAKAVIDPKMEESKYPFKDICGAVVAFKLIAYLYLINGKNMDILYNEFLPYAAIATICDVMPLIDENRDIVSIGLEILNNSTDIGIRALIEACDLLDKKIEVFHIGFIIGPTINSSGRLESADIAIKMLVEENYDKALEYAKYLRNLNYERQRLTDDGFNKIDSIINTYDLTKKFPVLILRETSINESVVGIIAGRIKEKYNQPTIILTKSHELLKGSGRSIENYDMFAKVSEFKHMLSSFGGHKMACGLSLEEEKFKDFVININNNSNLKKEDFVRKVNIDLPISLKDVTSDLIINILKLRPFGTKNPKPLLATKSLRMSNFMVLGKNENVIKFNLTDGFVSREALLFENINVFKSKFLEIYNEDELNNLIKLNKSRALIDVVYSPEFNEFRGQKTIQLKISNYRFVGV